jgi:hypothetical protein
VASARKRISPGWPLYRIAPLLQPAYFCSQPDLALSRIQPCKLASFRKLIAVLFADAISVGYRAGAHRLEAA